MRHLVAGAISLTVLWGSGADPLAQQKPPATPPAKPAATKPEKPTNPDLAVSAPRGSKLTGPEQLARAEKSVASIRTTLTTVLRLLATARREKDLVRLNCVREKLISVKGLLRVGEQASVTLQEAVSRGDPDMAGYEFQRIGLAKTKATQIGIEAKSCVGEVAVYTGPVQMVVDIDPEIPRRDPTLLTRPDLVPQTLPNLGRPFALSPAF